MIHYCGKPAYSGARPFHNRVYWAWDDILEKGYWVDALTGRVSSESLYTPDNSIVQSWVPVGTPGEYYIDEGL